MAQIQLHGDAAPTEKKSLSIQNEVTFADNTQEAFPDEAQNRKSSPFFLFFSCVCLRSFLFSLLLFWVGDGGVHMCSFFLLPFESSAPLKFVRKKKNRNVAQEKQSTLLHCADHSPMTMLRIGTSPLETAGKRRISKEKKKEAQQCRTATKQHMALTANPRRHNTVSTFNNNKRRGKKKNRLFMEKFLFFCVCVFILRSLLFNNNKKTDEDRR